jgi:hypothetical protein
MLHKLAPTGMKLVERTSPGMPPVGLVRARIATLSEVDREGDTYERGAFAGNDDVLLSAWNHSSWESAPPIGRGAVVERGDAAEFIGAVNLATESGRSHYELLKAMGTRQEWSFGFDIRQWRPARASDPPGALRVLQRLAVYEASPVLRAAGVHTATLELDGQDVASEDGAREYLRYVQTMARVR